MANVAAKGKKTTGAPRWFDFRLYKKTQGKRTRQLTAAGFGLLIVLGCRQLMLWLESFESLHPAVQYGLPALLLVLGAFLIYRSVNSPRFADFLIATEAEMSKVSWSSKQELKSATIVVLVLTLILTAYLFLMDRIWEIVLSFLGVLRFAQAHETAWRLVSSLMRLC